MTQQRTPMKEKDCRVCGDKTATIFNISFAATPICESCAAAIFIQQAKWYTQQDIKPKSK